MGIAGIPQGKVGAGFFRDQNRELIFHLIFPCRHKGSSVGADGKLSQGQAVMMEKYIILNVFAVLLRSVEIAAAIIRYHAVLYGNCKIQIFQFV